MGYIDYHDRNEPSQGLYYNRQMSIIFTIYGYYKIGVVIIGVWLLKIFVTQLISIWYCQMRSNKDILYENKI